MTSRITRRRRKVTNVGAVPGSFRIKAKALKPVITVTQYNADRYEQRTDLSPDQILETDAAQVTWISVDGLGNRDTIAALDEHFGIHDLAIEDVVHTYQRPKLEVYDDHLYIAIRIPSFEKSLELQQISLFVGKHYLLSWQEQPCESFAAVQDRIKNGRRQIRDLGPDYLAYALIDVVVDSFFPLLDQYTERLDDLEEQLSQSEVSDSVIRDIYDLRSDVRQLRRMSWATRDLIRSLESYEGDLIGDETRLHLRDVYDHTLHLVESLESARETCSDLRDLYMSAVSMRMNEIMKVLTIIATIFIPLSFIAGLYGMNFSTETSPWNMPETRWYFGYPMALVLMTATGGGMLLFFKKRGWLF
ncbi:MAG: magnesium/cobalt transporter CorA [Rubripirellula sp.]